jgi:hypothetical protein
MNRSLPFVPRAQPGESPLSLLRRGAAGNGHRSTVRFAHSLNRSVDHSLSALGTVARSPRLFSSTCQRIGVAEEQVSTVMYRRRGRAERDPLIWLGRAVEIGDLQFRRAKLCVACLLENGYAHAAWDHVAAVACARHAVLLDDACPCCGDPWTHDREPFTCGCCPEQMKAGQARCEAETATALNAWIDDGDANSSSVAASAWRTIAFWNRMGMGLSRTVAAAALAALLRGRWPAALPVDKTGIQLHPRVALAPLLTSRSTECVAAAHQLLTQTFPPIVVPGLEALSWPSVQVEALLGVGRLATKRLAEAGHLTRAADGSITATSVNDLLWQTAGDKEASSSARTLAELRGGKDRMALHDLITMIKTGEITSYHCPADAGLGGLVCSLRPEPPPAAPNGFSVAEAAERLQVNSESVRKLIHLGLIPATRGTPRSPVEWSIEQEALVRFDHLHVFASAIAASHRTPLRTIAARLRSAGLAPVSGPGIDGGVTYLFRRGDVDRVDLTSVLSAAYRSLAGRKRGSQLATVPALWNGRQTAEHLELSERRLREIVRTGWLAPTGVHRRRQMFMRSAVEDLRARLNNDFMPLAAAAHRLGQSIPQFRKTWIETGLVAVDSWAGKPLVSRNHISRAEVIWQSSGTASAIAGSLKRKRWLCPNLEKMGRIESPERIGARGRTVRLYARANAALQHYAID